MTASVLREEGRRARAVAALALLALAAAPAIATVLLVHALFGVGLDHFVPSFWNDQTGYWHGVAGFVAVGLDTGYNTPDERPLPWDAVRFGVNGPWLAILYGSVAKVVGWGPASSIPFNMVVLGAGLAAFGWLAALDRRRIALAGVVALTAWPVLLYVPTASYESLQHAIAAVLAACFVRALERGPELGRAERSASIAFLLAASVTRFSWALLLPCLLLLHRHRPSLRYAAGAVLAAAATSAAMLMLVGLFQPPGANSVADRLAAVRADPVAGSTALARLGADNLLAFLLPGGRADLDPTSRTAASGSWDVTAAQSWETIALLALAVLALAGALGVARLRALTARLPVREAAFHAVNLGAITVAALFLYLPYGYFRVIGAHLLLSLLVLVARRRVAVLAPIVVVNLVLVPSFLDHYRRWEPNFAFDPAAMQQQRAEMAALVRYTPDASSPWCNTLYLPVAAFDWRVTLVPAGFGIAYGLDEPLPARPRSRYVLSPSFGPPAQPIDAPGLRRLGEVPAGLVYENLRSDCTEARPG